MNKHDLLLEVIQLVKNSPLLTPGQKSLYISRLKTTSVVEQQSVLAFLQAQHALLEKRLKQVPFETVLERIVASFRQKKESGNGNQ